VERTRNKPQEAVAPELVDASELVQTIQHHMTELDQKIAALREKASGDFDATEANATATALRARKWVSGQKSALEQEKIRLQKIKEVKAWKKDAKRYTAVSRKSGELSQELITDAFVSRFNEELNSLGAGHLQVKLEKTRTSKGRPWHGIRFEGAVNPKQKVEGVLSDGEQRIVALAAFLADVRGRGSNAAILFDEPFTDLGPNYEGKAVERLATLAVGRQVLVFTHRYQRAKDLVGKSEGPAKGIELKRESWGAGEPNPLV